MLQDDTARLRSILARLPTPRLALEIGCGGRPGSDASTGESWIDFDLDLSALRSARRRFPSNRYLQANGCWLPFATHFDLILIRHPDLEQYPDSWQAILESVPAILNPSGSLVVTVYSFSELEHIRRWLKYGPLRCELPPERELDAPGLAGRDRFVIYGQLNSATEDFSLSI
ncbi:MAG TPA: class I SAM-dependent methyltransferase [Aggregatilineales bacterium]|nr:class I SAM-dependent methyltransferase [Aggregatilineales bacterium]